ncbi:hypothetical protein DSM101010T_08410 [Desulfovibrio subterraneus]|uniref:Uncharacterized protein n=1 Tax=Desulfovibrio subterraneus TaxID=2718620 RepID=A0A7J0BFQ8_9BACT|nr:hypothetical protein DSM101010T_08410 [Desulfovibrio subterraneus]
MHHRYGHNASGHGTAQPAATGKSAAKAGGDAWNKVRGKACCLGNRQQHAFRAVQAGKMLGGRVSAGSYLPIFSDGFY